jgi:hypothetical protein
LAALQSNEPIRVFLDPKDPAFAVINRSFIGLGMVLATFMGLVFTLLGSGRLRWLWKGRTLWRDQTGHRVSKRIKDRAAVLF